MHRHHMDPDYDETENRICKCEWCGEWINVGEKLYHLNEEANVCEYCAKEWFDSVYTIVE